MGLEAFTSDSSGSKEPENNNGKDKELNSVGEIEDTSPYFCAVMHKQSGEVSTFTGDRAFGPGSRTLIEVYIGNIQSESKYEEIDEQAKQAHGSTIEEMCESNPMKAKDFLSRVKPHGLGSETEMCPVCGDTILTNKDKYTAVDGEIVHSDHRVDEVVEELDIDK